LPSKVTARIVTVKAKNVEVFFGMKRNNKHCSDFYSIQTKD
jgi:hypothetical protein